MGRLPQEINGANFPHLQPMAELRRNQRGEIGRQHVKAHSCSHFSPCFDHTSPTQTDDGTSQIDHDIGAHVPNSFRTMSWVLLRPLTTEVQGWWRQGERLNVTAQWRDHLNWERRFTASMISPVIFKTLVGGPAGVSTHDLPLSRPALFQLSLKPAPLWNCTAVDLFCLFRIRGGVQKRTTGKAYGSSWTALAREQST